jgi:hypothetical protein
MLGITTYPIMPTQTTLREPLIEAMLSLSEGVLCGNTSILEFVAFELWVKGIRVIFEESEVEMRTATIHLAWF